MTLKINLAKWWILYAAIFNSSCYQDLKDHEVSATVAVTTPKRSGEPHGQPNCSHILSL